MRSRARGWLQCLKLRQKALVQAFALIAGPGDGQQRSGLMHVARRSASRRWLCSVFQSAPTPPRTESPVLGSNRTGVQPPLDWALLASANAARHPRCCTHTPERVLASITAVQREPRRRLGHHASVSKTATLRWLCKVLGIGRRWETSNRTAPINPQVTAWNHFSCRGPFCASPKWGTRFPAHCSTVYGFPLDWRPSKFFLTRHYIW